LEKRVQENGKEQTLRPRWFGGRMLSNMLYKERVLDNALNE